MDAPLEAADATPEPVLEPEQPAPAVEQPEAEFVGGLVPETPAWRRISPRRALLATAILLAAVLLVVGGIWLWSDSRHQLLGFRPAAGIEPSSAKAFTQALHRRDPVAMRAQINPSCVADQRSGLCFAASDDKNFVQAMANSTIDVIFLRRFRDQTGTVVIYDLAINNKSTGKHDDFVLVLKLAQNERIDHATLN